MRSSLKAILGVVGVLALAAGASGQTQIITDLYNTGVDNSGTPIADSAVDPHYNVTASPSGPFSPTAIPADGFPIPPWLPNDSNSRWIAPPAVDGDGPIGNYTYLTTFTLPATADLATASINGQWATDNPGLDILFNGVSTGQTASGFTAYSPFSLNSGFVIGSNTLEFVLENQGGPTGLRVDDMRGSYELIPEPTSLSLLALGGLGLLARRRRA